MLDGLVEEDWVGELQEEALADVLSAGVGLAVVVAQNCASGAFKVGPLQDLLKLLGHGVQHAAVECSGNREEKCAHLFLLQRPHQFPDSGSLARHDDAGARVDAGDFEVEPFDLG